MIKHDVNHLQHVLRIGSPNPYFYRCKIFLPLKRVIKIDFDENPRRFLGKIQKSEKTVCFSREKFSPVIKHDVKIDFDENPR